MKWYNKNLLLIVMLLLIWFVGMLGWLYLFIEVIGFSGKISSIIIGATYGIGFTYLLTKMYDRLKFHMDDKLKLLGSEKE